MSHSDDFGFFDCQSPNEMFETSAKNVFAGGDLIGSKATVAWAASAGRKAADSIVDILGNK